MSTSFTLALVLISSSFCLHADEKAKQKEKERVDHHNAALLALGGNPQNDYSKKEFQNLLAKIQQEQPGMELTSFIEYSNRTGEDLKVVLVNVEENSGSSVLAVVHDEFHLLCLEANARITVPAYASVLIAGVLPHREGYFDAIFKIVTETGLEYKAKLRFEPFPSEHWKKYTLERPAKGQWPLVRHSLGLK